MDVSGSTVEDGKGTEENKEMQVRVGVVNRFAIAGMTAVVISEKSINWIWSVLSVVENSTVWWYREDKSVTLPDEMTGVYHLLKEDLKAIWEEPSDKIVICRGLYCSYNLW